MSNSDKLKYEFKEYARNCILSRRPANKTDFIIGRTAADSYISFVEVDKLFSYNPEKWQNIKTIFDIESSERIKEIYLELVNDEDFNKVDSEGASQYFRSNAIKQYYCFLRAREVILGKTELPSTSSDKNNEKQSKKKDISDYDVALMAAIRTKPFVILGGFSGTGKSIKVKELAFSTCPRDGELDKSQISPGNYLLLSIKPNWHDATEITGFRSSVNKNYYVTDFMRFLVKAKRYEEQKVPFFVCLDEMNLAPVEEYFADFLSVIESRKRLDDGRIVTDAIVPASVFNDTDYDTKFNIFEKIGLSDSDSSFTKRMIKELKEDGLTIPQNVIIMGTVNMDDTTNSFSRKVIDRAFIFETLIHDFDKEYFEHDVNLNYTDNPVSGDFFISDEVRVTQMMDAKRFELSDEKREEIFDFVNGINWDVDGSPFKLGYRFLNECILLYRTKQTLKKLAQQTNEFDSGKIDTSLRSVFDDILMHKVLPRIEGDYEKCSHSLEELLKRAKKEDYDKSSEKIEFMIKRFGTDKSGFTTFWN